MATADLVAALAMHCAQQQALAIQAAASQVLEMSKPLPPGFPPGPPHDMGLQLATNPLDCMNHLKAKYGGAVGFKLAARPVILISSPNMVKEAFVRQSNVFLKAGTAFFPDKTLVGNGLLVSDGEIWKRQRRISNPVFSKTTIRTYRQTIISLAKEMVEHEWKGGGFRDVHSDIEKLTMNIIIATLFGSSAEQKDLDGVGATIKIAFKFILQRSTSIIRLPNWVPNLENLQYQNAITRLDNIVYNMIANKRAKLKQESGNHRDVHHDDLLTRLLQENDVDGSCMDDQSLRDELMTFLVAGQETSAALLTWCLVMLAFHQEVQEELSSEVQSILGIQGPKSEYLENLRYTEAFILETLRLFPPACIVGRCASQDTSLGTWKVPAGTTLLISIYLLHRDPLYWKRALEFEPSRWLQGAGPRKQLSTDCYWPFGGGPRKCIGDGFAMMETLLVLCAIVQKWKIHLPEERFIPNPQSIYTLQPEGPVYLELIPR